MTEAVKFGNIEWAKRLGNKGMRMGLREIKAALEGLGRPQDDFSGIHITGTKGKGTVAHISSGILWAHGLKVGTYTSPHILSVTERILVNGVQIGMKDLNNYLGEVKAAALGTGADLSYFEALTAAAFLYFSRSNIDTAVVEVGLGGRLDATRCFTPDVVVLTSMELEHTEYLGNTLADIAREKSHIIVDGKPVISAMQKPEAQKVVESFAKKRKAPLFVLDKDIIVSGEEYSDSQSKFNLEWNGVSRRFSIPHYGRNYIDNTAMALCASHIVLGGGLDYEMAKTGIKLGSDTLMGRQTRVISHGTEFILDIAHTPASAAAIMKFAANAFHPDAIILGILRDKDSGGIASTLSSFTGEIILTESSSPRALPVEELYEAFTHLPLPTIRKSKSVADALDQIAGRFRRVLVFGSATVVGEALTHLGITLP